jgi:hypothetical protein
VKLILFNCVGSEDVFRTVKEEVNSVHKINRKKNKLIDHILLGNCPIKYEMA